MRESGVLTPTESIHPENSVLVRCFTAKMSCEEWKFCVYGSDLQIVWECDGNSYEEFTEQSISWKWPAGSEENDISGFGIELPERNERARYIFKCGNKAAGASWTFDIAKEQSHLADTTGITGFMYSMAVGILAKCWTHGEELRQWHNLDSQIRNEGEKANKSGKVLNTALLNFGTPD